MLSGLVGHGRMLKRTVALAVVTVPALSGAVLATSSAAERSATRKAIPQTRPAWVAGARALGPAKASAPVTARVYLTPNGGMAALEQAALKVSTPGSTADRHFLTPRQYFARFGTRSATVKRVKGWLTGSGLKVAGVEAHNRYVSISGTVAAAERAFAIHIDRYRHKGRTVQAPSSRVRAPAGLASSVLAVTGVDTTPSIVRPAARPPAPPPAGFRNARPCSAYYGQRSATSLPQFQGATLPYAICGYTGSQFRPAYEGSTSLNGRGTTVAITDAYASPTISQDARTYARRHGDASYGNGQLTQSVPAHFSKEQQCDPSGWYGEETLDIEAVHAMAQRANIRFYASASCFDDDFLNTLARVNDDGGAQIVSNSWGGVEQGETPTLTAAYEQAFLQGATEGISYVFSSGDNGDEVANTGTKQADYPASDPYVTALGGTSTAINSSGALASQTGWGTQTYGPSSDGTSWTLSNPFLYGAGGGASTIFAQPAYQTGIAPAGARQVPDVAMDGDPTTGMLVGETQTFPDGVYYDEYRIGGTSLSAPLFAGMTALSFQHAGSGVGLLNPTIYSHATRADFSDVVGSGPDAGNVRVDYANSVDDSAGLVYSVRTFNHDSSLTVNPGWDNVTGLGSPNHGWLTAIGP